MTLLHSSKLTSDRMRIPSVLKERAYAWVAHPAILLLDEPFTCLGLLSNKQGFIANCTAVLLQAAWEQEWNLTGQQRGNILVAIAAKVATPKSACPLSIVSGLGGSRIDYLSTFILKFTSS